MTLQKDTLYKMNQSIFELKSFLVLYFYFKDIVLNMNQNIVRLKFVFGQHISVEHA